MMPKILVETGIHIVLKNTWAYNKWQDGSEEAYSLNVQDRWRSNKYVLKCKQNGIVMYMSCNFYISLASCSLIVFTVFVGRLLAEKHESKNRYELISPDLVNACSAVPKCLPTVVFDNILWSNKNKQNGDQIIINCWHLCTVWDNTTRGHRCLSEYSYSKIAHLSGVP